MERLFRANKAGRARFLAWSWLHAQIGNEYGVLDNFRRAALPQLKALLEVHSGLIVSQQMGRTGQKSGLWVSNLSTFNPDGTTVVTPALGPDGGPVMQGSVLPEPATLLLFLPGLLGLARFRRPGQQARAKFGPAGVVPRPASSDSVQKPNRKAEPQGLPSPFKTPLLAGKTAAFLVKTSPLPYP